MSVADERVEHQRHDAIALVARRRRALAIGGDLAASFFELLPEQIGQHVGAELAGHSERVDIAGAS